MEKEKVREKERNDLGGCREINGSNINSEKLAIGLGKRPDRLQ
jgi:hypothetical protein